MDRLLPSSAPKRPCPFVAAAAPPRVPSMDRLLEAFLAPADPSVALDISLERLLDARAEEVEKDRMIEGAMRMGIALLEVAKRAARRRAASHNSASWPLPPDLTVKDRCQQHNSMWD